MKNFVNRTNRIFTGFKSFQDMSLKVDQCFGSIDGEREKEREREREKERERERRTHRHTIMSFKYISFFCSNASKTRYQNIYACKQINMFIE